MLKAKQRDREPRIQIESKCLGLGKVIFEG